MAITLIDTKDASTSLWEDGCVVPRSSTIVVVFFVVSPSVIVTTFSMASSGALTKIQEKTIVTDTPVFFMRAVHVSGDIFAFTYRNSSGNGVVCSIDIDSAGAIGTVVDSTTFATETTVGPAPLTQVNGDVFAITYNDNATNQNYVKTVTIDSSGNISAVLDTVNPSTGQHRAYTPGIVRVASGIIALFWTDAATVLSVQTRSIDAAGLFTAIIATSNPATLTGYDIDVTHHTGTIYVVRYREAYTGHGWIRTVDIAADGTITNAEVDNYEFEPTTQLEAYRVSRIIGGLSGNAVAILWEDGNNLIFLGGIVVDSAGAISTATFASLSLTGVAPNGGDYPSMATISGNIVAVAYYYFNGTSGTTCKTIGVAFAKTFPTEAITRVTGLVHRYNRKAKDYSLEIFLGEVTSDFGLPQWTSRPQPAMPSEPGETEKAKEPVVGVDVPAFRVPIKDIEDPIAIITEIQRLNKLLSSSLISPDTRARLLERVDALRIKLQAIYDAR